MPEGPRKVQAKAVPIAPAGSKNMLPRRILLVLKYLQVMLGLGQPWKEQQLRQTHHMPFREVPDAKIGIHFLHTSARPAMPPQGLKSNPVEGEMLPQASTSDISDPEHQFHPLLFVPRYVEDLENRYRVDDKTHAPGARKLSKAHAATTAM